MTFSGPPEIPFGEVRTVFSPAVSETLAVWQASMEMASFRVVTRHWDLLPELETVLDDTLEALARAALGIWPAWYNAPMDSTGSNGRPEAADPAERNIDGLEKQRQRPLNRSWLEAASSLCRNNEIPLPRKFPREVQAEQLAAALDTKGLMVVMSGREERPASGRLQGLSAAALWFAGGSHARLAVVLPLALRGHSELESIAYQAVALDGFPEEREGARSPDEKRRLVFPVPGRPHPFSPGELELAHALAEDPDLCGLFQFNQCVWAVRGGVYMVDLLWPEGKVVIEVDGYQYHSGPFNFRRDRHRDYELLISGYAVLRLPHDEVMTDRGAALSKIRDVVDFRRTHGKRIKKGRGSV